MIRKLLQTPFKTFASQQSCAFSQELKISLPEYDTYKLDSYEMPQHHSTGKQQLLEVYENMTQMRKMEVAADLLYKERLIRGFCHLYDGQEAVIEGLEQALNLDDMMITAYRCHCNALKRGFTVRQIMAEMLGKRTGGSQGKGGSMHFYSEKNNFYGGNGIVGAQIPVGTGLAFAQKYNKKPNVSVSMYGDGAANQGQLFEAANMAYLWKLPQIFVCENNQYAMGTSVDRHAMNTLFYTRGDRIPGIRMDGNNFFHVYEAVKWAKAYAVENGPIFLEMLSYRYHGHSMSDPGITYRSREEVQQHRKTKDCLQYIKNVILENNFAGISELKEIDRKVKDEIDEAVEQAKADPFPTVEDDLYSHVYKDTHKYYLRGIEYDDSHFPNNQVLY